MLKSLSRYARYGTYLLLHRMPRAIVLYDAKRFSHKDGNPMDVFPWSNRIYTDEEHKAALRKAVQWLCHAQKNRPDDGFGSFHLVSGWTSSYIETTGYIVPTLLNYGQRFQDENVIRCAMNASKWLVDVQKPSGGWQGECLEDNRNEVVFNTAQVLRGLMAAYHYSKDDFFLQSAIKGADWLCKVQEPTGEWKEYAFMNVSRVYDSYVDVPLLMMYQLTQDEKYRAAAVQNLEWILTKQHKNGWFEDCDNTIKNNDRPILHTIAYTIDGLLDAGIMLNNEKYIAAAKKAADSLLTNFNGNRYLSGRYDNLWHGSEYMLCTGCAQMAIVWMKLYKHYEMSYYLKDAKRMNNALIFIQCRTEKEQADTKGAMPGSFPIWGKYETLGFPNWATKYFADSLWMESMLR